MVLLFLFVQYVPRASEPTKETLIAMLSAFWAGTLVRTTFLCAFCVENPTVLQMGQTTPSCQSVFWYIPQCCKDTDVDRDFGLYLSGNNQEAIESALESLHHSTDFDRQLI